MTDKQKDVCRDILNHYEIQSQSIVACEELAELQQAICKAFRGKDGYKQNLTEEIADVLIMIEQIKYAYGLSDVAIEEIVSSKLIRQLDRIEQE